VNFTKDISKELSPWGEDFVPHVKLEDDTAFPIVTLLVPKDMKCVLKSFKDFKFIMFFGRQDSLEAHLVCNIFKKWKDVTDKRCGGKAHDEEILFGIEERLVMIDLNDII
jgi:hypothetical protein